MRAILESEDITEVSPVFVLPARRRMRTYAGRTHEIRLRYQVQVELLPDGEPAYLRSHGTDFHIMPVEWLTHGPRRVYSLGPGVAADDGELLILLVQCIGDPGRAASLVDRLRKMTADVVSCETPEYGLPCLRISAAFPSIRYPLAAPGAPPAS